MKVKNFMKKAIAFCLGLAMTAGVGLGVAGNRASEVDATTKNYSVVINKDNFLVNDSTASSSYAKYDGEHEVQAVASDGTTHNFTFTSSNVCIGTSSNEGKLQFKSKSGYFEGTISGASNIVITCADSLTKTSEGEYFKIEKESNNAGYYVSISISFDYNDSPGPSDSYDVSFDLQEHGSAISKQTINAGGKVTKPSDPSESGWTFGGWYKEKACTTAYDFDTPVNSTFTLYAKWTENGGGGGGSIVNDYTKIVSGKSYFVRAQCSTNPIDYFVANGGTDVGDGLSRTNIGTKDEATPIKFTGSDASWSMQFENGNYLYLRSTESNGYYSVSSSEQIFTATNNSGTIKFTINSKTFARNSTYSNKYFGSYGSGTYVTLEECPPAKILESIAVKTAPSKITYYEGETFDPTGLVITATYDDTSTADIAYADSPTDFSFSPSGSLATTDSKVTITYKEKTVDQAITVNPDTLNSITLGGSVSFSGTAWDLSTVTLMGHYVSGDRAITSFTPTTTTSVPKTGGTYPVTVSVSFGGKSDTKDYDVVIEHGTLETDPLTVAEAMTIANNHSNSNVTTLYYVVGKLTNEDGDNPYNTTYGNFYMNDSGSKDDAKLTVYGVTETASALSKSGDFWSFNNPKDFSTKDSTKDLTKGDKVLLKLRLYKYVNTLEGDGLFIVIALSSIAVSDAKTDYKYGESFVAPTVTATYADGSTKDVTESTKFTGYDMNEPGSHTVTATYVENGVTKTYDYTITVGEKPVDSVDVYFRDSLDDSILNKVLVNKGNPVERPEDDPEKEHYSFTGWFEEKACQKEFNFDTEINDTTNIYAGWSEDPKYTVSYDLNGGTGTVPESHTDYEGESYTIASGENISKPNCTFKGWNTSSTGDGDSYEADEVIELEENLTLYAQWKEFVSHKYVKVTEAQDDWSGEYLIVYEQTGTDSEVTYKVFNGTDAGHDYVVGALDETDKLTSALGMTPITIESMDGGYSLKVNGGDNDGMYMSGTKDKNALNFTETASANIISFDNSVLTITSNGSALKFNSSAGDSNDRFRYYKSGQQNIQLYKLDEPQEDPIADFEALDTQIDLMIDYTQTKDGYSFGAASFRYGLSGESFEEVYQALVAKYGSEIKFGVEADNGAKANYKYIDVAENGDYHQFALVLNNLPFGITITAKAFVEINETKYYSQEVSFSVNSIAAAYAEMPEYSAQKDMLIALSKAEGPAK